MATIAEAARHVDLSERRFSELLDAGVIERQDRGNYDLEKVRVAYIRYLRMRALGSSEKTGSELERAADEARLAKAKADKAEMEAAEMRGELIPSDQVAEAFHGAIVIMKTRLNGIPARAAPVAYSAPSVSAAEAAIRREVDEALGELGKAQVITTARHTATGKQ